ncbi:MAG: hypothetical protein ACREA0_07125 [bacterium]
MAAELCRRNIYAQLTLGNRKRVDLLTLSKSGRFLKVEVKAKQEIENGRAQKEYRRAMDLSSSLTFPAKEIWSGLISSSCLQMIGTPSRVLISRTINVNIPGAPPT